MAKYASALRDIRAQLGLSQAECAAALGVALETFRTWDAGRRTAPEAIVSHAGTLKAKQPPHDRVPLQVLADELDTEQQNVRVNTVNPGPVRSPMRAKAYPGEDASTVAAPESVVAPFLYLLGPDSRGITGSRFDAQ